MDRLITFAIAATAAWLGVHAMRRWAMRRRMLDVPNDRSLHNSPVPTGGGLAIVVVFVAGLFLSRPLEAGWSLPMLAAFSGGALLIAVVSWIDDIRPLPVSARLLAQIVAAAGLLWAVSAWRTQIALPLVGAVEPGWLGLVLGFFWLVGMTNAYNFMDGVDGMAAGTAIVAGLGWFALGSYCGMPLVAVLGLLPAAASAGFLLHNRPPARIFMGDVGSAFLGYTFASIALIAAVSHTPGSHGPRLAAAGALLVWPFVFDTLSTFARRLAQGENVFAAHRGHLYQRLCLAGWSHGSVSLLYVLLAALGGLSAMAMVVYPGLGDLVVVLVLPLMIVGLWTFGRVQTTGWDGERQVGELELGHSNIERPFVVRVISARSSVRKHGEESAGKPNDPRPVRL